MKALIPFLFVAAAALQVNAQSGPQANRFKASFKEADASFKDEIISGDHISADSIALTITIYQQADLDAIQKNVDDLGHDFKLIINTILKQIDPSRIETWRYERGKIKIKLKK